jgi:aryl-alcohol dehydrogenase
VNAVAAVVETKRGAFTLREVDLGALRDDEILMRVEASGICHTDLICRDQRIPVPLPAVLGHEGAGIQTGAGAVLNVLRCEPGSTFAVFGAGAVGLAAALAARISGCERIVVVDVNPARLAIARELCATDVADASAEDAAAAILALGGADRSLEASGSPQALRAAVDCLVPTGVCGIVGAPAFGTEVSLDVTHVMTGGRVVRGIVEGECVPQEFLPQLVELWRAGDFPVDRFMTHYDFDDIERAVHDAESGAVVKPLLRMH